jgi:hypothetical protein
MYLEQHTINGYIEKYLKMRQKTFVLQVRLKKSMLKVLIKDIEESEMTSNDIII